MFRTRVRQRVRFGFPRSSQGPIVEAAPHKRRCLLRSASQAVALWFLCSLCLGLLPARPADAQPCYTCRTERCPRNANLKLWCGSGPDPLAAESPAIPSPAAASKPSPPPYAPTPAPAPAHSDAVKPPAPASLPSHPPARPVRRPPAVPVRPSTAPVPSTIPEPPKPPVDLRTPPAFDVPRTATQPTEQGRRPAPVPTAPGVPDRAPGMTQSEPARPTAPLYHAVDILSEPSDVWVRLRDGSGPVLGRTPLRQLRLMPGAYTLHFSREGYEPKTLDVLVRRTGDSFQARLSASVPALAENPSPAALPAAPPPTYPPDPLAVSPAPTVVEAPAAPQVTRPRSYSPARLAIGSVVVLAGIVTSGFGINALAIDGTCARTLPSDAELCQARYGTGQVGAGLLAAGLSAAVIGTVLMVIPNRRPSADRASRLPPSLRWARLSR